MRSGILNFILLVTYCFCLQLSPFSLRLKSQIASKLLLPNQGYIISSKLTWNRPRMTRKFDNSVSAVKSQVNFVGKTAKFFVSGIAGIVLMTQHQTWKPLYYIMMGVFNGFLSKVLKRVFKQDRPETSSEKGYGMPSSHAQSLFYFVSFLMSIASKSELTPLRTVALAIILIYAIIAR